MRLQVMPNSLRLGSLCRTLEDGSAYSYVCDLDEILSHHCMVGKAWEFIF